MKVKLVDLKMWASDEKHQHHLRTGKRRKFSVPTPELLNQKPQGWSPATCVFTSFSGDSDVHCTLELETHHANLSSQSLTYNHRLAFI